MFLRQIPACRLRLRPVNGKGEMFLMGQMRGNNRPPNLDNCQFGETPMMATKQSPQNFHFAARPKKAAPLKGTPFVFVRPNFLNDGRALPQKLLNAVVDLIDLAA